MSAIELIRESIPRMKQRACGSGPENSTDIQAMIEERRNMESSKKMTASKQVMTANGMGTPLAAMMV